MFLKKVCIFLAISFLAVDILLLSLYIQATNNLSMLSDKMLDNTVEYYSNAGIKIDKVDIVKRVPDNKIYIFNSDNAGAAKWRYFNEMKEEERADKCMSCGACEDACPQKLPIREHLAQVAELMQSL